MRRALSSLWLSICVAGVFVPARAQVAPPEQVAFYLPELKQTFDDLAAIAYLADACMRLFIEDCRLSGEVYLIVKEELVEISKIRLLPVDHGYQDAEFTSVTDIAMAMSRERKAFLRNLLEYELDLNSRYAAVAQVCPSRGQAGRTTATAQFNLSLFWGLPEREVESKMHDYRRRTEKYAAQIRSTRSEGYCESLRRVGSLLSAILRDRITPYVKDQRVTPESARVGEAVGSVWWMLASLELESGNERFRYLLKEESMQPR
jgi:hypothetical protein